MGGDQTAGRWSTTHDISWPSTRTSCCTAYGKCRTGGTCRASQVSRYVSHLGCWLTPLTCCSTLWSCRISHMGSRTTPRTRPISTWRSGSSTCGIWTTHSAKWLLLTWVRFLLFAQNALKLTDSTEDNEGIAGYSKAFSGRKSHFRVRQNS